MNDGKTGAERFAERLQNLAAFDPTNPTHYKDGYSHGAEVIDITENLNFNRGNAVKYLARAGRKGCEVEDLKKALWYVEREIERMGRL